MIFLHFYFAQSADILQCAVKYHAKSRNSFILKKGSCCKPSGPTRNIVTGPSSLFLQPFRNDVILLKVFTRNGMNAYDYFTMENMYSNFISEYENKMNENYKSPLLQEWNNARPTNITITWKNDNKVVEWAIFQVNENDNNKTSWLNKDNLIDFLRLSPEYFGIRVGVFGLKSLFNSVVLFILFDSVEFVGKYDTDIQIFGGP